MNASTLLPGKKFNMLIIREATKIKWQKLNFFPRAVCRKHELMQYDLEMAAQDLASKKQQCEELATGVSCFPLGSLVLL